MTKSAWLFLTLALAAVGLGLNVLSQDVQTIGLIPQMAKAGHNALSRSETGQLRWYAASMAAGAVLVMGAIVLVAV